MNHQRLIYRGLTALILALLIVRCGTLFDPQGATRTPVPTESPLSPINGEGDGTLEEEVQPPLGPLWGELIQLPWLLLIPLLVVALVLFVLVIRATSGRQHESSTTATKPLIEAAQDQAVKTGQVAYLTLVADSDTKFVFPLKRDAMTIGRAADNDLVIDEHFPGYETVSRNHARLYRRNERWLIKDLNSRNGVYVNQKRTGHNVLQEEGQVSIGGVTFNYHARSREVTK